MVIDYQKSKIYAIRSPKTDSVYIGATTLPLKKRFEAHFKRYRDWVKSNKSPMLFVSSFFIIEKGDAYIDWIEDCPCNSKRELSLRECEIINAHINAVNIYKSAYQTREQYNAQRKQYSKRIREQDREKYNEYHRRYRESRKLKAHDLTKS